MQTVEIDHFTGRVTREGETLGFVRFNGQAGTYGRRWEVTTPDGRLIERVAKRQDAAPILTSGTRTDGTLWA